MRERWWRRECRGRWEGRCSGGGGEGKHLRRYSMTNRFMMSVAAVALIAGAGFANAQGTGTKEQPSAGSTAQQSAPSSERGNSAAPSKPSSDMKATQSDEKAAQPNKRAQDDLKAGQKSEKSAQDNMKGEKSKSMSSETKTNEKGPAAKDMKAEGRDNKMNAEQEGAADGKSTTTQSQSGTSGQSQTTGQAGASAKLSTEQRTRITSVIREQHVQPLAHVNFSIRVGCHGPGDVRVLP